MHCIRPWLARLLSPLTLQVTIYPRDHHPAVEARHDRPGAHRQPPGARTLPTDRIVYSAITERSPLVLPGNARVVVRVIVNVEEVTRRNRCPAPLLTPPAGGWPSPDVPNWAWREYGNRVGFWWRLRVFDDFKLPAVLAIDSSAIAADQFEQIDADAEGSAPVMAVVVHPSIMGAPNRTRHFHKVIEYISTKPDVLVWTGEQIGDWYQAAGSSKQASP
jgi:peptidoglycan/xylan/chitin deacetylase (PgdA/CDA1 family)